MMMQQAHRPLEPHADRVNKLKSNLYYARGITPKCVTSGGAHLQCIFAPGQHSSEETSQRWRAAGDTVSDLIRPGIEPQTFHTDSVCLTTELTTEFMVIYFDYCFMFIMFQITDK